MTTVHVGEDAFARLVSFWAASVRAPALVVMDARTEQAAGAGVLEALRAGDIDAEPLIFDARSPLRATPEAAQRISAWLPSGGVPIAVGSGTLTDLVRYAADLRGQDFVIVATAASMDGYASSVAALERDGVKVTYPARAPRAIFADPHVLAAAPAELTRAGLGDLLAKATAHVDWLTAHLLYGEPYAAEAAALVQKPVEFAVRHATAILGGDAHAICRLFHGLVQSGRAMAMVGSSRPASGCEHHASHFWDLLAARGLRPYAPHGLQVAYATRFAMRLQRLALDLEVVRPPKPASDPLGPEARRWLGEPTPDIRDAVAEKRRFASDLARWPTNDRAWAEVRAHLHQAVEIFDAVGAALSLAGVPSRPGFLGIDERILKATFPCATRLRARYTMVDFLEGQRRLEQAVDAFTTEY